MGFRQKIADLLGVGDTHLKKQIDDLRDSLAEHVAATANKRSFKGEMPYVAFPLPKKFPLPANIELDRKEAAVSVVLGTFNRLPLLKLAIESIRNSTIEGEMEIIVVDGGSTDGTKAWLVEQEDIITIVHNNRGRDGRAPRRKSWGYFMNLGFRASKAKWICMVSDDCILHRDCISEGIKSVEIAEDSGLSVGGGAFYFRDWPIDKRYFVQHTLGGRLMINHGLYRRAALEAVGFAEDLIYDFYKADSDITLKLWHAGYEIVPCPQSFIDHLMLPSERARVENNQTMEADRQRLWDRWQGIFVSSAYPTLFHAPHQIFSRRKGNADAEEKLRPFVERDIAAAAHKTKSSS